MDSLHSSPARVSSSLMPWLAVSWPPSAPAPRSRATQVYSLYGTQHYTKRSMGTANGFTGQYNDSPSELDYYNARYYDPAAAVFLSANVVQGNRADMNLYDYMGENPETWSDLTGERYAPSTPTKSLQVLLWCGDADINEFSHPFYGRRRRGSR